MNEDIYRLKLHLMPEKGWMNDPNGLCFFKGKYHVFFQYTPDNPQGGNKCWGHYSSVDLINWEKEKIAIFPDTKWDENGAYSGSALIVKDKMYIYYTGNVTGKSPNGREANVIMVTSENGYDISEKKLIMTNKDYPSYYSNDVRDPKVWMEDDRYYMVLGGRTVDNVGKVMLFSSKNLYEWKFEKEFYKENIFGYMWECPDMFKIEGQTFLSISPQGLKHEKYKYQNQYQSGYFIIKDNKLDNFTEWDMGFDFYAPQTFEDSNGRRILIGWAGMADTNYDNEPTVKKGWQHALTLPRELSIVNNKIHQIPVKEIETLRTKKHNVKNDMIITPQTEIFEILAYMNTAKRYSTDIFAGQDRLCISYDKGCFSLILSDKAGRGRKIRRILLTEFKNIRIICDTSLAEIYINDGEYVMTTRFYFDETERNIQVSGADYIELYEMKGLNGI